MAGVYGDRGRLCHPLLSHAYICSRGKAMPNLCLCICESVSGCLAVCWLKNTSSRVAKAFKDVILNKKQSRESYWNASVPDTIQGGSFAVISATSYYRFLGSTLSKLHVVVLVAVSNSNTRKYRHMWN